MSYLIGSGTPFTTGFMLPLPGKRPSFNVIYVDPLTMLPIDYETHALDLDYANKYDDPRWALLYNYRDTFNLIDLSP